VEIEVKKPFCISKQKLVLVVQDESTCQTNDGPKPGWVIGGKQPLKKKGVCWGLHQSDVICSTFGWLHDTSQHTIQS
jgi:hypothetical protein